MRYTQIVTVLSSHQIGQNNSLLASVAVNTEKVNLCSTHL